MRVQTLRRVVDPGVDRMLKGGPASPGSQAGQPVTDTAPIQSTLPGGYLACLVTAPSVTSQNCRPLAANRC
jgi:hypothetical protein